jgi:hypothetical protein
MKKLITCLFLISGIACFAQENSVTWDYPIKPGMEEWKNFKSRPEMVAACQVPQSILEKIDTENLVELCFNYPLIHDINAYNILQIGFDNVTSDFNGFTELFQRHDAGAILLERYLSKNVDEVKEMSESWERGLYIANLSLLELFLSQEIIISKLTRDEKTELVEEASIKFDSKIRYAKNYGLWGARTSPLLMGRVMKLDRYSEMESLITENNKARTSLETGSLYDFNIMQEIANKAQNYLNQK